MAQAEVFDLQSVKKRKVGNWIDGWISYTESLASPELWRKWSGISLIAGALERRVWIETGKGVLYPNLYVILVGPPGVGKTAMTSRVWGMWNELTDEGSDKGFHLASSSLTSASLADELKNANRRIFQPGMEMITFNALAICSNELGVFLPEYDNSFMSKLTDVYDGLPYSERRRTKDLNFSIPRPVINFLAATTPSYLNNFLPEGAWEQGFLSRTMLVFNSETIQREVFSVSPTNVAMYKDLVTDLRVMFSAMGKMTWTGEAIERVENWHKAGDPPLPEHPKLMNYNTRRIAHLLKLCMIASIAEGDKMVITAEHFNTALDWLIELEQFMPDIFKSMVVGGDSRAMTDCWYYCLQTYAKEQREVSEARVVAFLAERIPAFNVERVIKVMVASGLLIPQVGSGPGNWFKPKPRKT